MYSTTVEYVNHTIALMLEGFLVLQFGILQQESGTGRS